MDGCQQKLENFHMKQVLGRQHEQRRYESIVEEAGETTSVDSDSFIEVDTDYRESDSDFVPESDDSSSSVNDENENVEILPRELNAILTDLC